MGDRATHSDCATSARSRAGKGRSNLDRLALDQVHEAKIWDVDSFKNRHGMAGIAEPELHLGSFKFGQFGGEYLISPPAYDQSKTDDRVCLRGQEVLVRPGGFLLWQTKERIGTPSDNPQFICFVDGKSTRARTGILVHLTAPTIRSGWVGNVVLEIANLGPFTFVLKENDVIAQLTVATISSHPKQNHAQAGSSTANQAHVSGSPTKSPKRKRPKS